MATKKFNRALTAIVMTVAATATACGSSGGQQLLGGETEVEASETENPPTGETTTETIETTATTSATTATSTETSTETTSAATTETSTETTTETTATTTAETSGEGLVLDGTAWVVRAFALADEWFEAVDGTELTVEFSDGRILIYTGCNSGNGSYTLEGTALSIGPVATTRAGCLSEALSDQEALFVSMLNGTTSADIDGQSLTLNETDPTYVVLDRR
jgi:heat shock protein HslJ